MEAVFLDRIRRACTDYGVAATVRFEEQSGRILVRVDLPESERETLRRVIHDQVSPPSGVAIVVGP